MDELMKKLSVRYLKFANKIKNLIYNSNPKSTA